MKANEFRLLWRGATEEGVFVESLNFAALKITRYFCVKTIFIQSIPFGTISRRATGVSVP